MRASFFRSSVVVLLLAGCGPSEGPKPVAPIATTEPKPVPVKVAEDRSPVEAPAGLVAQVHAQNLRGIARSIRGYLPQNAPALDPRAIIHSIGDGTLDRLVDVDKPADLAVSLPEASGKPGKPPLPTIAFAFAVEEDLDVAAAVKESYDVDMRQGGVMALVTRGMKNARCVVAPALGAAKRRLVCALEGDVMTLAPWLARGVTRGTEPAAPLHGEVEVARIRKVYQKELEQGRAVARGEAASEVKTGFAEIDRVLKAWTKSAIDEAFDLLDDLERVSIDIALPAEGMQPTLSMTFGGTKSWVARVMLAGGDTLGAAPAQVGKLPGDGAWLAGFSRATPQSDALVQPIQTALKDLVDAAASEFKWPTKDRDAALDVVKAMFPAAADTTFVSGRTGKVELPEGAPAPYGLGKMFAHSFLSKTFSVSSVERDTKAPIALAKAVAAWAQKPSFAQTYKLLTSEKMTVKVAVKPITNKELPKGSFAQRFDLALGIVDPDAKDKKKAKETPAAKLSFDTIIVPDGASRSWVGMGQNLGDGELWAKLKGAMSGAPTSPLSAIPGYEFATKGTPSAGMLMTVDGTVKTLDTKGKKGNEFLSMLPDGGHSAVAWRITPSKPPKAVSEITVHLPRDVISGIFVALKHF